jgi:hypothetical protein
MRTKIVLAALAVGAATIGTSLAPQAAADTTCQTTGNGSVTVCAQGSPNNSGPSAAPTVTAPGNSPGGCTNAYGGYQNCQRGGGP